MFGIFEDLLSYTNLDTKIMTMGTDLFVAKEKACSKISDVMDDTRDFFGGNKPSDKKEEEKTSKTTTTKDSTTTKVENKENDKKEEENSSQIKVVEDHNQDDNKEVESKKKEAEEAADLFFEGIKSTLLAGAETDYEKKSMAVMIDKIKEKSNLKEVIAEIALEISEMQKHSEDDKPEVVKTTPQVVPGVTYEDKNIGLDMSGLVIPDEETLTSEVKEAPEPKEFTRETPKQSVTTKDIRQAILNHELEQMGKGKKKK